MPVDYPGGYLLRFDGIDVGRFRDLVAVPRGGQPIRNVATPTAAGPGTLELRQGSGVSASGDLLLHRWQKSSIPPSAAPSVVVVGLNAGGSPIARWQIRNARPGKSLTALRGTAAPTGGAIRTESLTIVHDGIQRIP